jgi:hypothetical protein
MSIFWKTEVSGGEKLLLIGSPEKQKALNMESLRPQPISTSDRLVLLQGED